MAIRKPRFLRNLKPRTPDDAVLFHMNRLGDRSDVLRPVDFFFYFPSESSAKAATAELTAMGFQVDLRPVESEGQWACVAVRNMTPGRQELLKLRSTLTMLASKHGGMYDGWGCPVVDDTFDASQPGR